MIHLESRETIIADGLYAAHFFYDNSQPDTSADPIPRFISDQLYRAYIIAMVAIAPSRSIPIITYTHSSATIFLNNALENTTMNPIESYITIIAGVHDTCSPFNTIDKYLLRNIIEIADFMLYERKIDPDGTIGWYYNGKLHRGNDQPAVIYADGSREWWRHGELHRVGQPAVIHGDDVKREWWQHGKLYREDDLPQITYANGGLEWYQHDKLHRDGDLPAAIEADNTQAWYQNGKLHRDGDQPAIICADDYRAWYQHGKLHRDGDQPAIIRSDGTREWYQHGKLHREHDRPTIIYADGTDRLIFGV